MEENSAPLSHQKWMLAVEHPQSQAQMILVDAACPSHIRPPLGSCTGILAQGRARSPRGCWCGAGLGLAYTVRRGEVLVGQGGPPRGGGGLPSRGRPSRPPPGPQVAAEVTASVGSLSRGKMAPVAVLGSAEGKQV